MENINNISSCCSSNYNIYKLVLPPIPDIKGRRVVPLLGADVVVAAEADAALLIVLAATVAAVILENVFVISDGELYIYLKEKSIHKLII